MGDGLATGVESSIPGHKDQQMIFYSDVRSSRHQRCTATAFTWPGCAADSHKGTGKEGTREPAAGRDVADLGANGKVAGGDVAAERAGLRVAMGNDGTDTYMKEIVDEGGRDGSGGGPK